MDTEPNIHQSTRVCGIARKLGYTVECPPEGCSLLHAMGEELPEDDRVCPIEELARGDNAVVLWTLDELRRELQRDPMPAGALRFGQDRGSRHADAMRRWS